MGLVHPCKIYNILGVGAPVLYLGPQPSHVTEIIERNGPAPGHARVAHGEVERTVQIIQAQRQSVAVAGRRVSAEPLALFSQATLLPQLIAEIEALTKSGPQDG